MENVTRDIISDLWPLYVSGDASADTRALVEAFLREEPELARQLMEDAGAPLPGHDVPSLTADHELRTLAQIRRRLTGPRWALLLAIVFTMQAFGRIVSDTSFTVSPRNFIATAVVAAVFLGRVLGEAVSRAQGGARSSTALEAFERMLPRAAGPELRPLPISDDIVPAPHHLSLAVATYALIAALSLLGLPPSGNSLPPTRPPSTMSGDSQPQTLPQSPAAHAHLSSRPPPV